MYYTSLSAEGEQAVVKMIYMTMKRLYGPNDGCDLQNYNKHIGTDSLSKRYITPYTMETRVGGSNTVWNLSS